MTLVVGQITVVGTAAQETLVEQAIRGAKGLGKPLADLPRRPYLIEFHTPAEFLAKGYVVPGTTKPAWGYVVRPRVLWLNSALRAGRIKYTAIHEIGHAIDTDYLDEARRQELMLLMDGKPTNWARAAYRNRPREIYADAFAEALGFDSPLDTFYGDIADADLPKLLEATFRVVPPAPGPDPVPLPLPLPDPRNFQRFSPPSPSSRSLALGVVRTTEHVVCRVIDGQVSERPAHNALPVCTSLPAVALPCPVVEGWSWIV